MFDKEKAVAELKEMIRNEFRNEVGSFEIETENDDIYWKHAGIFGNDSDIDCMSEDKLERIIKKVEDEFYKF
jgi:hypothetical protein